MRRFSHVSTLFVAASIALSACSQDVSGRPPEAGDRIVAKVEDSAVWASDVRREAAAQGLIAEGETLAPTSDLFRRVLDEVVDQRLLAREAERRGLDDSALAKRRLEATRQRILGDMLVETVVNGTISDQAVETIYREQLRLAETIEEIRARLILSRTQADANAVIGLLAQGATFEALVQRRSADEATRFSGGDLGYLTLDSMPRAYADALREPPKGALVGPFQTPGGWAVVRIDDRRKSPPPTLEQARPQIVRYLTYEGVRQLLETLRGKAEVEFLTPAGPARPASTTSKAVP